MTISWRAALSTALVLLLPTAASAGNDDSILLGNDAALSAGAVVANVNDGSALWYNPAGLARASKDSVDVGASAFALRKYNMPGLLRAEDGSGSDASFVEFLSIPSALTYVRRFDRNLVGGLGLFTSQLSDYTLRAGLEARDSVNQVDLRFNNLFNGEAALYHLALGLGFELPGNIQVGLSLLGDYGSFVWSRSSSYDIAAAGTVLALGVESSREEETVLGFHGRLGVTYSPSERFSLGLSVQTPAAYFFRSAHLTTTNSTANLGALVDGSVAPLAALALDERTSNVDLGLYAPVRVRLGTSVRVLGGTISLEGDVQSQIKDRLLEVDRAFVWNVRAGAVYPVSQHLRLGAGLFTDRGPERKDELGTGPIDFYGATLGGEYESIRGASTDGQGRQTSGLTFSTTLALRYALGLGKFQGTLVRVPVENTETVAEDIRVHELTLHIGSGLYF